MAAKHASKRRDSPLSNQKPHAAPGVNTGVNKSAARKPAPSRMRIVVLLTLLAGASALLLYRSKFGLSAQRERLYLGDGVILSSAPPLPSSDLQNLRAKLQALSQAWETLNLRLSDQISQSAFGLGGASGWRSSLRTAGVASSNASHAFSRRQTNTTNSGRAQNMLGRCKWHSPYSGKWYR